MARAYLRLDPGYYERKVIDQDYPAGAALALIGALCLAEYQPTRGRFRSRAVLRTLLGPNAKWVSYLVEHGDLVERDGVLYVDGWDEWQEGDWKVTERVRRIRARRSVTAGVTAGVTPPVTVAVTVATESDDSVATVYTPSDGGRQSVIDSGRHSGAVATPPSPPRDRGGRRTRSRDLGPMRSPTRYDAGLESDDDVPWLSGSGAPDAPQDGAA